MKKIIAFILTFTAVATGFVFAEQTYVVGVEQLDYMPHFRGGETEFTGYARDLLDSFAEACDCEFIYRPLPIKRLFDEFIVIRSLDFKYPDDPCWRTDLKGGVHVFYSNPTGYYVGGTMVLPENKGRGLSELKSMGTPLGFTPVDYLEEIAAGRIFLEEVPGIPALLDMAIHGRVEGANLDVAAARYHLEHSLGKADALVFDSELPYVRGPFHMSTIKHPEMIRLLNVFLDDNQDFVRELRQMHGVDVFTD